MTQCFSPINYKTKSNFKDTKMSKVYYKINKKIKTETSPQNQFNMYSTNKNKAIKCQLKTQEISREKYSMVPSRKGQWLKNSNSPQINLSLQGNLNKN